MARDVIVATFEERDQAYETAREIERLGEGVVDVKSVTILQKDLLGNVTELDAKGVASAWGTIGGGAVGVLLGALVGSVAGPAGTAAGATVGAGAAAGGLLGGTLGATVDIADTGLKADYVTAVSSILVPGHTAIVAEVEEYSTQPVDDAVWRHGGVIVRHPISAVLD